MLQLNFYGDFYRNIRIKQLNHKVRQQKYINELSGDRKRDLEPDLEVEGGATVAGGVEEAEGDAAVDAAAEEDGHAESPLPRRRAVEVGLQIHAIRRARRRRRGRRGEQRSSKRGRGANAERYGRTPRRRMRARGSKRMERCQGFGSERVRV